MLALNGKRVDLVQLDAELIAAGVAHRALGTSGDGNGVVLFTYDLNGAVTDLPAGAAAVVAAHTAAPPITDYAAVLSMSGRLRTTDATPAEVYRVTLATLTGYRALASLLGVDAGNGAVRMIYASIVAKRLGAGALLVGSPVVLANHQDAGASTWAITAAVSGNDFVITVTGQAGRTIDWLLDGQVLSFKPAGA